MLLVSTPVLKIISNQFCFGNSGSAVSGTGGACDRAHGCAMLGQFVALSKANPALALVEIVLQTLCDMMWTGQEHPTSQRCTVHDSIAEGAGRAGGINKTRATSTGIVAPFAVQVSMHKRGCDSAMNKWPLTARPLCAPSLVVAPRGVY